MMYILVFIALVITLAIPISSVSVGGPRMDWFDDSSEEGKECWVDGYDAGFAGKYDEDRANQCEEEGDDNYNASWDGACNNAGYTENECNDIKNDDYDDINHESLQEENRRDCYDGGYEDGRDHPYDHERGQACDEYGRSYYNGFIDGCVSVEGNTREICESATDA